MTKAPIEYAMTEVSDVTRDSRRDSRRALFGFGGRALTLIIVTF
jgi:hypothetical protein